MAPAPTGCPSLIARASGGTRFNRTPSLPTSGLSSTGCTEQERVMTVRMLSLARVLVGSCLASSIALPFVISELAAQTDIDISMAAAPATPRILGPAVLGSNPGSPFLYTVPTTGQGH